jgi:hypothetical protein
MAVRRKSARLHNAPDGPCLTGLPDAAVHVIAGHCTMDAVIALAGTAKLLNTSVASGGEPLWAQLLLSTCPFLAPMRSRMSAPGAVPTWPAPTWHALLRQQLASVPAPRAASEPAPAAGPAFKDLIFSFEFGAVGGEDDQGEQDASALSQHELNKELEMWCPRKEHEPKLTRRGLQAKLQAKYHKLYEQEQQRIEQGFVRTEAQTIVCAFEDGVCTDDGELLFEIPALRSAAFARTHDRLRLQQREVDAIRECGEPHAEEHCNVHVRMFDRVSGGFYSTSTDDMHRTDEDEWATEDTPDQNGRGADRLNRDHECHEEADHELCWVMGCMQEISTHTQGAFDEPDFSYWGYDSNDDEQAEQECTGLDACMPCIGLEQREGGKYFIVLKVMRRFDRVVNDFFQVRVSQQALLEAVCRASPGYYHEGSMIADFDNERDGAQRRVAFRGRSPGQTWLDTLSFIPLD